MRALTRVGWPHPGRSNAPRPQRWRAAHLRREPRLV